MTEKTVSESTSALRGKLFASKNRRKAIVKLQLGDESVAVEVRHPGVAMRAQIIEKMGGMEGKPKTVKDAEAGKWLAVSECCFDPESGERIFAPADREELLAQPDVFDTLAREVATILQPVSVAAVEEIEKNSEATRSGS